MNWWHQTFRLAGDSGDMNEIRRAGSMNGNLTVCEVIAREFLGTAELSTPIVTEGEDLSCNSHPS